MKKLIFLMLTFSSFMAVACGENEIENVGGSTTDGKKNEQANSELTASFSSDAEIECVELPPITVTGYYNPGPVYYWMGGGSWLYFTYAGGGGGGTPSSQITDDKLDFCLVEGTLQAIYDNWPILGTVSAMQSYAQTATGIQRLIFAGAISDIKAYVASGGESHAPPQATSENTINWYDLNINWLNYAPSTGGWDGVGAMTDSDAIPYFAEFLKQMGLGDGTIDLNNDPSPTIGC
ncbi:MAG: hypothetical protein KDI92_06920 [Xanthomonadales bacterium]|nr:hypothetical protein [Xanthomonadales bacterium]